MLTPNNHAMKYAVLGFALFLVAIIIMANMGLIVVIVDYFRLPLYDKLGHFVLIGIMGFLVNLMLKCERMRIGRFWVLKGNVWVLIPVSVEELSQGLMPTRTLSLEDWLMDVAGLLFFGWIAQWIVWRKRMQHRGPRRPSHRSTKGCCDARLRRSETGL